MRMSEVSVAIALFSSPDSSSIPGYGDRESKKILDPITIIGDFLQFINGVCEMLSVLIRDVEKLPG